MKTQLIMLDTPIIVSDETATSQDYGFNGKEVVLVDLWENRNLPKVIASTDWDSFNLPSIDWNGLEEEFGWADVEKLFLSYQSTYNEVSKSSFKAIFKLAQSLNEKKFSLEDMEMAFEIGRNFQLTGENNLKEFLESLQQPKVFDIEVDGDWDKEFYQLNNKKEIPHSWSPKITNNSIKIIKKL